jgi:predicted tellurium resistance membrane protein TerC
LDISLAGTGAFFLAWLAIAIPTVIHLAGRKTDTRRLTVFWGIVAALVPPFGLLFILALLLKDDRPTA